MLEHSCLVYAARSNKPRRLTRSHVIRKMWLINGAGVVDLLRNVSPNAEAGVAASLPSRQGPYLNVKVGLFSVQGRAVTTSTTALHTRMPDQPLPR